MWRRMEAGASSRDVGRKLVWFHVASAGELLQALPVLRRLLDGGFQCALTVTSPSGIPWAQRERERLPGLIVADYLPLDCRRNARRLLRLLSPAALVYVKYDLWPNLIWEAGRAGVAQFLISAALRPGSARGRSFAARSFYASLYRAVSGIFTVTAEDRDRFLRAAPSHPNIALAGDTKYDMVLGREAELSPPPFAGISANQKWLVAGSTWPEDEARILPALIAAMRGDRTLRSIIAPHENDGERIEVLEAALRDFSPLRLSTLESGGKLPESHRVILVDSVGQLAGLYRLASIAYVGGGFGAGVHNVLEPAVMGVPVVFGPRHQNAPEAAALLEAGGAFLVRDGNAFGETLTALLEDATRRENAGAAAKAHVLARSGAAETICERIRAHLDAGGSQ
ncbi:MAG: glycosyltransferase N-terminal domain-containing protein [bacterium]